METLSTNQNSRIASDMGTALQRWFRFSNEAVTAAVKIGQPLLEVYFKGLGDLVPTLQKLDLGSLNPALQKKNCDIPETACPPYCVCDMEWDACEGETVTGTLDVKNTGKQAVNFSLSADAFRTDNDNTGIVPQISPASFALAPNVTQSVTVSIQAKGSFDPATTYRTQIKVRGRYEHCVQLNLRIKRKTTPVCVLEHGEIPTRIVAHHWYDHFQCEELCFEPVGRIYDQPTGEVMNVASGIKTHEEPVAVVRSATSKSADKQTRSTKKKS